jgi:hypothetical protein
MGVKVSSPPYRSGQSCQVVNVTTGQFADCDTVIPWDDTEPTVTEGDEVMALSITPKYANSKIKVDVVVQYGIQNNNNECMATLIELAIDNSWAIACGFGGNANYMGRGSITFTKIIDMTVYPPSGGTYNFKVRLGAKAGGVGFNGANTRIAGGRATSGITITEIKV